MSVRQGLLALLAERPMYGYQLRQEFEGRTGGTWPLNIGQVYTTLGRLQRDGLVQEAIERGHDGSVVYALTSAGREEVERWWRTPVARGVPARDELAIKLALAVTSPGVDVAAVVQTQRVASMRSLQEYTRLTRAESSDLAWRLVVDSLVFSAEAEVRWLDHVEQRLARAAANQPTGAPQETGQSGPTERSGPSEPTGAEPVTGATGVSR